MFQYVFKIDTKLVRFPWMPNRRAVGFLITTRGKPKFYSLLKILLNLEAQDSALNCKTALCCILYLNPNFLDEEVNIVTKNCSKYGGVTCVACVCISSIANSKHLFMQILNNIHLELAVGFSNNFSFQTVSNCILICWLIY